MKPSERGKNITDPEISNQTRHRDQGCRRVAAFLTALEPECSLQILRGFSPEEITGVLAELEATLELTATQQLAVMEEFGCRLSVPGSAPVSGAALAERIRAAFSL